MCTFLDVWDWDWKEYYSDFGLEFCVAWLTSFYYELLLLQTDYLAIFCFICDNCLSCSKMRKKQWLKVIEKINTLLNYSGKPTNKYSK